MLGLVMVSSRYPGGPPAYNNWEERVKQSINTEETCELLHFNDDYVVTLSRGVHRLHYLQSGLASVCFEIQLKHYNIAVAIFEVKYN